MEDKELIKEMARKRTKILQNKKEELQRELRPLNPVDENKDLSNDYVNLIEHINFVISEEAKFLIGI